MVKTKTEWINLFRGKGEELLEHLAGSPKGQKDKAVEINRGIKSFRDNAVLAIEHRAKAEGWKGTDLLKEILLLTYASYIAMLEYRNRVWAYEYMAFSRRIGELWEPFCRLPFEYPVKRLNIIEPPDFKNIQDGFVGRAAAYISGLNISREEKSELKKYYEIPWELVDSGGIKLDLDLHFEQEGIHYNCDFKSGFSSNEKGNTNRLLLVANIYRRIGSNEKTLLFVRQQEDENNHYLQTLKNSRNWEVYCADACYAAIFRFTGFNLRAWLDENIDWHNDISHELKEHLAVNDLLKYLTW